MINSRDRNIVVKSQFSINGSRGKDVGSFISGYVARDSATEPSMAYVPDPSVYPEDGDGVAFTLDSTAVTRKKTLEIAEHVQELHTSGGRAIQQMVISFDPMFLIESGIVPEDLVIEEKGDYEGNYDDVRLRYAIREGIQSLIDHEGYRDGKMIGAIQHDTLHLHAHVVVYEDHPKLRRMRGKEEKGMLKESSLNQLAFDIGRNLELTKTEAVPTQRALTPKENVSVRVVNHEGVDDDTPFVDLYLQLLEQQEREEALRDITVEELMGYVPRSI